MHIKLDDRLYNCLLTLIDLSAERQNLYRKSNSLLGGYICKELQTIHLRTARQSGHTYAIAKLAVERFKKMGIICPSSAMAGILKKYIKKETGANSPSPHVIIGENQFEHLLGIGDFDAIAVDCSFWVKPSTVERLYKCLSPVYYGKEFFYIFME